MLPCENSLAGRVSDIHHLLPDSGLYIIGEQFQRVEHCLLGVKGATIADIKRAHSHTVALGQVRSILADLRLTPVVEADTAGAAAARRRVGPQGRRRHRLRTGRRNLRPANPARQRRGRRPQHHPLLRRGPPPAAVDPATPNLMTTFVFRVRNVPAALYKALGGFATNGINMTKLESYMINGEFTATQFLCDVEGHPEQPGAAPRAGGAVVLLNRGPGPRRLSGGRIPAGTERGGQHDRRHPGRTA